MSAHRFSASVASRYMACPASANLHVAIPNWTPPVVDPSAGAKGRGTSFHQMLEPIMRLSPGEVRQMAKAIEYVAELRERRRFSVLVEATETAAWLQTQPDTTADLVLYTADELHVLDFKWGRIPVSAVNNKQLLYYAVTYAYLAPKARQVSLHIVQPAADTYEEWVVDTADLAVFMADAQAAEKKILALDTTFGPSDDCTFCPANPHSRSDKGKPLCPALMQIYYPAPFDVDEILAGD